MARATRTLNPLHFEDLEPHRFEDLVRQLVYDFRDWHSLEALGRSGADEGVDILGNELLADAVLEPRPYDEDDEVGEDHPGIRTREWRIQCKREKRIGPKKMHAVLDALFQAGDALPYGLLVAASCDFSKRTRTEFRARCLKEGVEEFLLWGRAELEDLLFQPRNDHLLWAYFGISIRVRRRSWKTILGSRLATKRRLAKHLGDVGAAPNAHDVLIRSAEAEEYPWPKDLKTFLRAPKWRYYRLRGLLAPDLVLFETASFFAFWDEEEGTWDYIEGADTSWPRHPELVGLEEEVWDDHEPSRRYWEMNIEKDRQARYVELSVVHYDQVILVDDLGDAYHPPPHLVVDFEGRESPFRRARCFVETGYGFMHRKEPTDQLTRKKVFPTPLPAISDEEWREHLERQSEKHSR